MIGASKNKIKNEKQSGGYKSKVDKAILAAKKFHDTLALGRHPKTYLAASTGVTTVKKVDLQLTRDNNKNWVLDLPYNTSDDGDGTVPITSLEALYAPKPEPIAIPAGKVITGNNSIHAEVPKNTMALEQSEQYLFTCMRYIELNPIRAKNMVKHPKDYPWSSYHFNANNKNDPLVTTHKLYRAMGNNRHEQCNAYKSLFKTKINNTDLDSIRNSTNKAWVLGSDKFKKKIEKLSSRRINPIPKGRPKKYVESDPN